MDTYSSIQDTMHHAQERLFSIREPARKTQLQSQSLPSFFSGDCRYKKIITRSYGDAFLFVPKADVQGKDKETLLAGRNFLLQHLSPLWEANQIGNH